VNYRTIIYTLGRILWVEAALLALPMLVAALYGERLMPYIITILVLLAVGALTGIRRPKDASIYARDGFMIVALAWIAASVFGALPFVLSGDIPDYMDAFFETVAGFTTTGGSILSDVEVLTRSGLFWRNFTQFIGGMGILVFLMAVLPLASEGRGMHIMRAEVTGPSIRRIVSSMSGTAKILYGIYFALTTLEVIALLICRMPLYDSVVVAMGTAGTGGFSVLNNSIAGYNSHAVEMVVAFFMLLYGINFNLYYFIIIGKIKDVFKNEELRVYLGIAAVSIVLITADLMKVYHSLADALRYAVFQVTAMVSSTAYVTADFSKWPTLSASLMVVLMFIGGCAGSTAGGVVKMTRLHTLVKGAICEIRRMIHPNAVVSVKINGKPVQDGELHGIYNYFVTIVLFFTVSFLLLCFDGNDVLTTFTALAACINNIGPGLGNIGPTGNYQIFSTPAKLILCFNMIAGRLEIFPMLMLLSPSMWKGSLMRRANGAGSRRA